MTVASIKPIINYHALRVTAAANADDDSNNKTNKHTHIDDSNNKTNKHTHLICAEVRVPNVENENETRG